MLIELAIGDAYGAGFEYNTRETITKFNDLSRYIQHPKHKETKPGMYTDDTQMSIAIVEAIISGEPWNNSNLARRFVDCFKRDPRQGYAGRFYRFLQEIKDGQDFLAKIRPHSDKSGAAMRGPPIGVYATIEEVIEKSVLQARLTHDTVDGVDSAIVTALMTHYFIYNLGPLSSLSDVVEMYVGEKWVRPWKGPVGSKGEMSVRAALTAVRKNNKMSNLLKACIAFSGDVDTVATIALAAASCSKEYEQDLPKNLYTNLENGKYGHDYLLKLDQQLMGQIRIK